MHLPQAMYIYQGCGDASLNYENLVGYARTLLPGLKVSLRKNIFQEDLQEKPPGLIPETIKKWALLLASLKIINPAREETESNPFPAEVEFEIKKLRDPGKIRGGPLYEGLGLALFFSELIPPNETPEDSVHIIFTDRLFATWDENNRKYHVRVSVCGFPSLISTTGIIEAPAKPREFYIKMKMGFDREALKKEFSGRFLDYDDPRLTEVLKGYILQALFFYLYGDPFCPDPNCRLYNAHFQEGVLLAQLYSSYEFCSDHREMIRQINGNN